MRPPAARRRSGARLAAVQFSYQMEMNPGDLDSALAGFAAHYTKDIARQMKIRTIDQRLFESLARLMQEKQGELDTHISSCLESGWRLDRLDRNELGLLRAGVAELLFLPEIPARTVIAEYTALADLYAADTGFVNAVLDRLARQARPSELSAGQAGKPSPAGL